MIKPFVSKPIVINFYGGPGTGKSTTAARIFYELKIRGISCELVTEYAKRKVWEGNTTSLGNQLYISAKQLYSMWTVSKHVQVIVTDSPIILGMIYGNDSLLDPILVREYHTYTNIDIFLVRTTKYDPQGRYQTEADAKKIDGRIRQLLLDLGSNYSIFDCNVESIPNMVHHITSQIPRVTRFTKIKKFFNNIISRFL